MVATPAIKDYIIRDEIEQIYEMLNEGDYEGMMSLNMSLVRLVNAKLITQESAIEASNSPTELETHAQRSLSWSFFISRIKI
ncbi:MAG: hypothetical protein MZV64_65065 [Ignavibacteriales bacterium]|nr:hypothetical protein [Ignavibacteriales bacterium]